MALRTRRRPADTDDRAGAGGPLLRIDRVKLGYWVDDRFHVAVGEATFAVGASA